MPEHTQPYIQNAFAWLRKQLMTFWRYLIHPWWHRIFTILAMITLILLGTFYGIAQWYIHTEQNKPYVMGVSFIPDYASFLGVDPQQTLDALINDVGVRNFRLVSYWNDIEPTQGKYDFSQLDWELQKINAVHGHVLLSVGLKQPRWPECHPPGWVDTSKPEKQWYPQLAKFITAVVNRYKNNPAIQMYQVENEYFLPFGACYGESRWRLVDEYNLVKKLDPSHHIMISRSQNDLGVALGAPKPDVYGVSVYKRVWDGTITKRYIEYPFPAWWYAGLAGWQKLVDGRDTIIHELQAEPWPADDAPITKTSLAEESKTLNAARLKDRFMYARATGIHTVYYWGAEYWYYRWKVEGDKSVWNVAVQEFHQAN